jgi:hypothetical protein
LDNGNRADGVLENKEVSSVWFGIKP